MDAEDAAQKLAEALGKRYCLMIVDDVWNAAHLRPFLRGGPNCARLITTRNRDTLPTGTNTVDVDAMRTDEAVALLGAGLPVVETQNFASLQTLAARLGEWPLLLKLANGTLRARVALGQPLDDALAWVNRALDKRGLTAFDERNAEARDQAVALTMSVSLDLLNANERARYGELAIFPEDVDVPVATLEVLWGTTGGLDDFDVEELCQRLADLSLVQYLDLDKHVLRLQDVARAYLSAQHEDLPAQHAKLVDAYAAHCNRTSEEVKQWATGPDDGYVFQYLPYHLSQAERPDDLRALLLDFDWLRAKLHATDINALIADYNLPPFTSLPMREIKGAKTLRLAQGALRLSALVLARDPAQLPGQLLGRLGRFQQPELRSLCRQIEAYKDNPWLRPLQANLIPPGGSLLRTLTGHTDAVIAVALSADGRRVVSASSDQTLKVWNPHDGRNIATFSGDGALTTCAVALDSIIIAGSASGRVHFLKLVEPEA